MVKNVCEVFHKFDIIEPFLSEMREVIYPSVVCPVDVLESVIRGGPISHSNECMLNPSVTEVPDQPISVNSSRTANVVKEWICSRIVDMEATRGSLGRIAVNHQELSPFWIYRLMTVIEIHAPWKNDSIVDEPIDHSNDSMADHA